MLFKSIPRRPRDKHSTFINSLPGYDTFNPSKQTIFLYLFGIYYKPKPDIAIKTLTTHHPNFFFFNGSNIYTSKTLFFLFLSIIRIYSNTLANPKQNNTSFEPLSASPIKFDLIIPFAIPIFYPPYITNYYSFGFALVDYFIIIKYQLQS